MSEFKDKKIIRADGGFLNELMVRLKLVLRLMGDRRVNPLYKVLPIASLIYFVSPLDFLPFPIPVDDALVLWLGTTLFVELAPPDVVQEHLDELRKVVQIEWNDVAEKVEGETETGIIDAEFNEVKD